MSSWAQVTHQTLISHTSTCQSLWLWPRTHPLSLVPPFTNSLPLMSDQPISCSCFMMSYDTCLWLVDFSCLKLFLYLKDDIRNDKDYWWKKNKTLFVNDLHSRQLSVPLESSQCCICSSSIAFLRVLVLLMSGSTVCGSEQSLCTDADGCFSGCWRWRGRLILRSYVMQLLSGCFALM